MVYILIGCLILYRHHRCTYTPQFDHCFYVHRGLGVLTLVLQMFTDVKKVLKNGIPIIMKWLTKLNYDVIFINKNPKNPKPRLKKQAFRLCFCYISVINVHIKHIYIKFIYMGDILLKINQTELCKYTFLLF